MLVACLTPTRDRRLYLPLAIQCFLNQTHTDRELLILDDGDDDIRDLIPKDRRITCVRNPAAHATLGAKLNTLAAMTSAQVLCNWDDDDWYSNDRIAHQLETLTANNKAVVGFRSLNYWDETTNTARRWTWSRADQYACGGSQIYTRHCALAHPLPNLTMNVDYHSSHVASDAHELFSESGLPYYVARFHIHSYWRQPFAKCGFAPVPIETLPPQFFADLRATRQDRPPSPQPPLWQGDNRARAPRGVPTAKIRDPNKR